MSSASAISRPFPPITLLFFAEEEERIPPLRWSAGVLRAQELAQKTDPAGLLDKLSRGVHFGNLGWVGKAGIVLSSHLTGPTRWSSTRM